jgi:hypothetical protein
MKFNLKSIDDIEGKKKSNQEKKNHGAQCVCCVWTVRQSCD